MPLTRNQSNAASQARLAAANSSETSTSKDSANDQGGTSTEAEPPRRDSPENCSICLGPFNNKSFTSSCAHSFCFVCLKQWSKVKAECPLCKQPFTSIFHNIRSNQQYDIYELPHQPSSNPVDFNSIFNYVGGPNLSFAAPTHHLFSLSQPAFDADLTLSNFSRFQFRHRRYDRYLNPLGSIHGEHPYSFNGPSINPASHVSAATWPRGAEEFRREVYRRNLGPPAVILGCENSTYRLTPAMVAASSHRIHRIMPWLTRELRVLLRSHQNVRLAISIIQPLLTQVTIDSMYFQDKVAPLLGRRSRQFIQEFVAFANSALNVQNYDRKSMYRRRDTAPAVPSSSSNSSSENDVVEVTDISPEVFPNPSAPGPSQTQPLNLSRTGWESPTLGPWEIANTNQESAIERVSVSSESDDPVYRPDLRDSDSGGSKPGSDIIFVKYDKPWEERSPINLTSDSEAGEGNESSRKKKKSKHKKKKKEMGDLGEASGSKKDKSKKSSSKSKHKDKSKSSSKAVVSDDERGTTEEHKRRHSQSSVEHHKVKRHKKSKSKKEKLSDREIVDRYFAQAMSQDKEDNSSGSEDQEADSSAKHKERSSSKEKSKKRKKSRKHSKDSHNQSHRHTYKKHPSGHKKSSNRADCMQDQPGRLNTQSPVRQSQVGGPSRSDAIGNDNLSQHEPSSSTMSVVPGFQPPYLGMPDTVQHIPVNLWVSAWPALSVSHTYPPPPPPIAMGPSIPQSSNTSPSTMTSNPTCTGETSRAPIDRLSISSDSSSDSSESESDDAQDLQIPSLQNVHSRTKQWLETNFPDLGRPQATPASVSNNAASACATSSNGIAVTSTAMLVSSQNVLGRLHNGTEAASKEKESDVVEVVSIASEDDDVVVCSSDDSSNVGDLWVVDVDNSNKQSNKINDSLSTSNTNGNPEGTCHISTFPFNNNKRTLESAAGPSATGPSNIILPQVNKSFQPFKLQKKPAMPICGKDPFFPPMTHSSDEDGEVDDILQSTSHIAPSSFSNQAGLPQSAGLSTLTKTGETSNIDNLEIVTSSPATPLVPSLKIVLDSRDPMNSFSQSVASSPHRNARLPQDTGKTLSTSLTTASYTTATSSMFSVLPSLTSSSHCTRPSNTSSGFSYLPYANLPQPTSVSSMMSYTCTSTIAPAPPPLSLPLPYPSPFPQVPLLPTTSQSSGSLLPSLYTSQSQAAPAVSYFPNEENESNTAQPTPEKDSKNEDIAPSHCYSVGNHNHFGKEMGHSTCVEGKSEKSNSDNTTGTQNDCYENTSINVRGSATKCQQNNFSMETDVESSDSSYINSHQRHPSLFVNNLVSDLNNGQMDSEEPTFQNDSDKLRADVLESAAVNGLSSSFTESLINGDSAVDIDKTLKLNSVNSFIPSNLNVSVRENVEESRSASDLLQSGNPQYHKVSVLPANSFETNSKPFYTDILNANSGGSVLSANNKPFDALDDSYDEALSMTPNSSSIDPNSVEPLVDTSATASEGQKSSLSESEPSTFQKSPKVSPDQVMKPLPDSRHLYNSTTSHPVFKPYSNDNSQASTDQFKDALASSDSDNEK